MKKIVSYILIFGLLLATNSVQAITAPWGRAQGSFMVGVQDDGSVTGITLDTAFVNGTSGDFMGFRFNAPVTQTNAAMTVYVYCNTTGAGTPDSATALFYASASGVMDDDRPTTGAASSTSAVVDMTGCLTSARWQTFEFTDVTTVAGLAYFGGITNTHATPASNNFSIVYRGSLDSFLGSGSNVRLWAAANTTDGFATDPANTNIPTSVVIKFADGTIIGNPFVATAAITSNTNYRGMRISLSEDVTTSCMGGIVLTTLLDSSYEIYQGSTQIVTVSPDKFTVNNSGFVCFPTITLTGGLDYDLVYKPNSATGIDTQYTMGNGPYPADLASVLPNISYVNGATPGSFTETATTTVTRYLLLDDNPAISGGGTDILGNVIQ